MRFISKRSGIRLLLVTLTISASAGVSAQEQNPSDPSIIVNGVRTAGPEIKGVISARNGDKIKVTSSDGTNTIISINDSTRIKAGGGLFGVNRRNLAADSL